MRALPVPVYLSPIFHIDHCGAVESVISARTRAGHTPVVSSQSLHAILLLYAPVDSSCVCVCVPIPYYVDVDGSLRLALSSVSEPGADARR